MENQTTNRGHAVCTTQSLTFISFSPYLRVTLLLLFIPVVEISAGAHRDLQTRGVSVVGQSQLELSRHGDALEEAALCADAAVTPLWSCTERDFVDELGG